MKTILVIICLVLLCFNIYQYSSNPVNKPVVILLYDDTYYSVVSEDNNNKILFESSYLSEVVDNCNDHGYTITNIIDITF